MSNHVTVGTMPEPVPDDDTFMTVIDFAKLTSDQQLAVWDAANSGLVSFTERRGQSRRYHREDVRALLAQGAAR